MALITAITKVSVHLPMSRDINPDVYWIWKLMRKLVYKSCDTNDLMQPRIIGITTGGSLTPKIWFDPQLFT